MDPQHCKSQNTAWLMMGALNVPYLSLKHDVETFCALMLGDVYHDSYGVNGLFDKDRILELLGITDCIFF